MKRMRKALGLAVLGLAVLPVACRHKEQPREASRSAAPPEAPPAETLTLSFAPSAVGDRYRETRRTALSISVEFWRDDEKLGSNELSKSEEYARSVEVLGLVGGAPSKVRVHYDRYRLDEARLGQPPRKDAQHEGQTYLVDGSNPPLQAFTADGKPVGAEDQESLEKLHAGLGGEDPVLQPLSRLSLARGVSVKLDETTWKALMPSSGSYKGGTIQFVGVEDALQKLEWKADFHTEEEGGLELDWHVQGRLSVSAAPARVRAAQIDGSIDASGQTRKDGQKVKMIGAGVVHDEYAWSSG